MELESTESSDTDTGVIDEIARMPAGAFISEAGLARIFGKHRDSIKAAVERGELPPPVSFVGKRRWTAGSIVQHAEKLLANELKKYNRSA